MDAQQKRAFDAATISLLGREYDLMRGLVERILPVVERKASAGACVHDIWTEEQWRDFQRAASQALLPVDERDADA